ncbi:MAG: ABC transporter ATP-binding protein [Actinomycetota bacterium]
MSAAGHAGRGDSRIGAASVPGVLATVRHGLQLSPEMTQGIWLTLLLSAVSTAGRLVVPFAVQQTVDTGILADGGPDVVRVAWLVAVAAVAVVVTGVTSYVTNVRLSRATEAGLAGLRTRAFRHVHDLAVLTQNTERRGSLVSRVTSDVDTISMFLQFGGLILLVSVGQLVLATVLMLVYSWQLTLLVWLVLVPFLLAVRPMQRVVSAAYGRVRERVGEMLGAVSESVVGADTIRAYAIEDRTQRRIDAAVEAHRKDAVRAQVVTALTFSTGVLVSGVAIAGVVVGGTLLGMDGGITLGELLAFLFLAQLFTQPLVAATEVLNEMQNAVAGWRRVLAVLDTPADVADPGPAGVVLPRGEIVVRFDGVSYRYPGGAVALRDVALDIPPRTKVAVVGETGSGKTTLAKLLTRLMDPTSGRVLLDGVDLREVRFSSLRERVVMVPQEGFLFDTSLLANIRYGRPAATDADVELALTELGLSDWVEGLPHGLRTPVGQRGESLSAGERQLVALARAYLADPDLLVLDEATSAVDPATEVRIARALDGVTAGRTSVTIAHRLSTAEAADMVVVVDAGRVVEVGTHDELVGAGGVYERLHASWSAQHRLP